MLSALNAVLLHIPLIGPTMAEPSILLLKVYYDLCVIFKINTPSFLQYDFHCWITTAGCTFFLSSGLHFLSMAISIIHTSNRKSILSSLDPLHRDDTQTFGFYVVSTGDRGLQLEDPKKSGILHQRMIHHILTLACWMLEKGQKG